MAVMTPPDCLKWPETPQTSQADLKSAYLVTLIYPFVMNFAPTLTTFGGGGLVCLNLMVASLKA